MAPAFVAAVLFFEAAVLYFEAAALFIAYSFGFFQAFW